MCVILEVPWICEDNPKICGYFEWPNTSEGILKASEKIFLLMHGTPVSIGPKCCDLRRLSLISIIEQVNTFHQRFLELLDKFKLKIYFWKFTREKPWPGNEFTS